MTITSDRRNKGQVFSIDVLFALLPIVMIVGASLQYMYLAEEDARTLAKSSELEGIAREMSDYVMSNYLASWTGVDGSYTPYLRNDTCQVLKTVVDDFADARDDFAYSVVVRDRQINTYLCQSNLAGQEICDHYPQCNQAAWWLVNATSASVVRFMPAYDGDTLDRGKIASVTFTVFDKQ